LADLSTDVRDAVGEIAIVVVGDGVEGVAAGRPPTDRAGGERHRVEDGEIENNAISRECRGIGDEHAALAPAALTPSALTPALSHRMGEGESSSLSGPIKPL